MIDQQRRPSCFSALRSETKHHHQRVERAVDLPARLRSLDCYRDLLERFYGYYSPLEQRLMAVASSGTLPLDLQPRLKAALLRQDLLALGRTAEEIIELPVCQELPQVADAADALGCLYVLEGATLGGQIISREVRRVLGLGLSSGCAFFYSYGTSTGKYWSDFCSALADYGDRHPGAESQVIAAATETFARLERWIEGAQVNC